MDTVWSIAQSLGVAGPVASVVAVLGLLEVAVWVIAAVAGGLCLLTVPVVAGVHARHQRLRLEQRLEREIELRQLHVDNLRITKQHRF